MNGHVELTSDIVEPFQRAKLANGEVWLVVPNAGYEGYGKYIIEAVNGDGWSDIYAHNSPRAKQSNAHARYAVVELYARPEGNGQTFDTDINGKLLWKYSDEAISDLEKRIAYFQTHIDAVKENLASLEAELAELKEQSNK